MIHLLMMKNPEGGQVIIKNGLRKLTCEWIFGCVKKQTNDYLCSMPVTHRKLYGTVSVMGGGDWAFPWHPHLTGSMIRMSTEVFSLWVYAPCFLSLICMALILHTYATFTHKISTLEEVELHLPFYRLHCILHSHFSSHSTWKLCT